MPQTASRPGRRTKLALIGPFPPPVNGASKNTKLLADAAAGRGAEAVRLNTETGRAVTHVKGAGYHLRRAKLTLTNGLWLLANARRLRMVYLVPDGGLGIWYNLLTLALLRLAYGGPLILHHRNYSHIARRSPAMARIVGWFGSRAMHVFLEGRMGREFESLYGGPLHRLTVRNAATCDVEPVPAETGAGVGAGVREGPIRIGFLSNLTDEKGFHIVESGFLALAARHPDLRFAVAGPVTGETARRRLDRMQQAIGARFTYHGPVSGPDKQRFFAETDLFIFPTIYRLEAQPNVLYEAMAGGCVIVSTRHACIPDMLEGAPHRLVDIGPDLADDALEAIEAELAAGDWPARRAQAVQAFERSRAQAREAQDALLDALAGTTDARSTDARGTDAPHAETGDTDAGQ